MDARSFLKAFMRMLFVKNIIGLQTTSEATEIARLAWLSKTLQEMQFPAAAVAALMIVDWAARTPEYTAQFIGSLIPWSHSASVAGEVEHYRVGWLHCGLRCFWTKQTRMNLRKFLQAAPDKLVIDLAVRLAASSTGRPRFRQFQELVNTWPFVGSYCSFAMLRAVGSALRIRFRDVGEAAEQMSLHTSTLAQALPLQEAVQNLRHVLAQPPDLAFAAWIFCETTKILRHEAVLAPLDTYRDNSEALFLALTSRRAKAVLEKAGRLEVAPHTSHETHLLQDLAGQELGMQHTHAEILNVWRVSCKALDARPACKRPAAALVYRAP